MINFCCVFYGDKYDVKYVQVLYNMLKRHLTIPYKFICFTDHVKLHKLIDGDIECRRFHHNNYEGWWNKLQLFSPEARLEGVNFYLDLDVVILENIDKFITYSNDDEISITRDFSYPEKGFNSSVIKWNNKTATDMIWHPFLKDKTKLQQLQGDQNVLSKLMISRTITKPYPDEWTFSYKWHDRKKPRFDKGTWDFTRLGGASISVFHGQPNPHEAKQDWVVNNWK